MQGALGISADAAAWQPMAMAPQANAGTIACHHAYTERASSWRGMSWRIETLGDYMQEPFTDPIHAHLVACLATLHMTAGLDVSLLRFHKEDPKTSHKDCPGSHIDKQHLIQEVHALIVSREAG